MTFFLSNWKFFVGIGIIIGIIFYGQWEHNQGFKECKADYDKEKVKLEKESKDAIKAEKDQADSDKQLIADYYNRLLSSGPKLPRGSVQTKGSSGVLPASSQCTPAETDLRFERNCAEDAAKLLRVTKWLKTVGIKPD